MAELLRLRCPRCSKEVDATRELYDPTRAVVGVTLCPRCIDKTNAREPDTYYYDADGEEIPPEEYMAELEAKLFRPQEEESTTKESLT